MLGQSDWNAYAPDVMNAAQSQAALAQLDLRAQTAVRSGEPRPVGVLALAVQEGQITAASIANAANRLETIANTIFGEIGQSGQMAQAPGSAALPPSHMGALQSTIQSQRDQLERLLAAVSRLENL